MDFTAIQGKVEKISRIAKCLLREVRSGQRRVTRSKLSSFCGVPLSMILPIPLAQFYAHSLHDALADLESLGEQAARKRLRTRISNQAVAHLEVWRGVDEEGRQMQEEKCVLGILTDAAKLGWGGKVLRNSKAEVQGEDEAREVWTSAERKESITWKELKAL